MAGSKRAPCKRTVFRPAAGPSPPTYPPSKRAFLLARYPRCPRRLTHVPSCTTGGPSNPRIDIMSFVPTEESGLVVLGGAGGPLSPKLLDTTATTEIQLQCSCAPMHLCSFCPRASLVLGPKLVVAQLSGPIILCPAALKRLTGPGTTLHGRAIHHGVAGVRTPELNSRNSHWIRCGPFPERLWPCRLPQSFDRELLHCCDDAPPVVSRAWRETLSARKAGDTWRAGHTSGWGKAGPFACGVGARQGG